MVLHIIVVMSTALVERRTLRKVSVTANRLFRNTSSDPSREMMGVVLPRAIGPLEAMTSPVKALKMVRRSVLVERTAHVAVRMLSEMAKLLHRVKSSPLLTPSDWHGHQGSSHATTGHAEPSLG